MALDEPQPLGQDRTAGSSGSGQKQGQERLPPGGDASFQEAAPSRLSSSLLPVCMSGSHVYSSAASLAVAGSFLCPGAGGVGGGGRVAPVVCGLPGSVTDPTPPSLIVRGCSFSLLNSDFGKVHVLLIHFIFRKMFSTFCFGNTIRFVKTYVSGVWKTSTSSCPCAGLSSPPPPPGSLVPQDPTPFLPQSRPTPTPRPFTPAPHSCPILIPHPVWSEVGGTTVDFRGRGPGSGRHVTQRWLPCASGLEGKTVHLELSGAGDSGPLSPHSGPLCVLTGALTSALHLGHREGTGQCWAGVPECSRSGEGTL